MTASGPDLNLLVSLRALLEEANVTRAGARLNMGQSSMSVMLARLRTQYHDELLVQVGRSFELTPLARQLLPQVQLTIPLVERAFGREEVFDPATAARRFTFLMSDYALAELAGPLKAVRRDAPGIRFDFGTLPSTPYEVDRDLLHADFLVAVPGTGMDTDSVDLLEDHYVLLVDADHPALVDGAMSLDDFLSYPHVRSEFGRGHLTPYQIRLHQLGLEPEYRATASSLLVLPSAVAGTDLIAGVPSRLLAHASPNVRVRAVPTPFESVEIIERLTWHSSRAQDPGHRWLRERLLAHWTDA